MYLSFSLVRFSVSFVVFFFFFKQKTAYEMRISDWSSDVCSSDLRTVEDDAIGIVGSSKPAAAEPDDENDRGYQQRGRDDAHKGIACMAFHQRSFLASCAARPRGPRK